MNNALFQSDIKSLKLLNRGKVRDIYDVDEDHLLIVTTDRLSAFDVVLPTPIPGKGEVLTAVSNFWFDRLKHIVPNQLTGIAPGIRRRRQRKAPGRRPCYGGEEAQAAADRGDRARLPGRLGLEGIPEDRQRLRHPAARRPARGRQAAAAAVHPFDQGRSRRTRRKHQLRRSRGTARRRRWPARCATWPSRSTTRRPIMPPARGIIIADTKFEFGLDEAGRLYLIDEALTPDSSRFWPADQYQPGSNPPSFDKQYVRDWLESTGWNKKPPAPSCPPR